MHIRSWIKYAITAIRKPTVILRLIDKDGSKKIVIINRTPFGAKAIGKFEVSQEFSPTSYLPDWEPIEFSTPNDFRERRTTQ